MRSASPQTSLDFTRELFYLMNKKSYACLNYLETSLDEYDFSKPVYLLIKRRDKERILSYLVKNDQVQRMFVSEEPGMLHVFITLVSSTTLKINLIYRLIYNGYLMIRTREILQGSNYNHEGIRIPDLNHTFEYIILDHMLRRKNLPEKYAMFFKYLDYQTKNELLIYLNKKYHFNINNLGQLVKYKSSLYHTIVSRLNQIPENNFILRSVAWLIDVFWFRLRNSQYQLVP